MRKRDAIPKQNSKPVSDADYRSKLSTTHTDSEFTPQRTNDAPRR